MNSHRKLQAEALEYIMNEDQLALSQFVSDHLVGQEGYALRYDKTGDRAFNPSAYEVQCWLEWKSQEVKGAE